MRLYHRHGRKKYHMYACYIQVTRSPMPIDFSQPGLKPLAKKGLKQQFTKIGRWCPLRGSRENQLGWEIQLKGIRGA